MISPSLARSVLSLRPRAVRLQTCNIGGAKNIVALSGLKGTWHRASSTIGGAQQRAVSTVGGTQPKEGRTPPKAVTEVGGTQHRAVSGVAISQLEDEDKKFKAYDDLPGPSLLTIIYYFFLKGYILYSHELQLIFKKRYGRWWKSTIGKYKMVNIADPGLLEMVVRQEGKYPLRNEIDVWKLHRDMRNLSYGPFTEYGKKWHDLRTVLNQRMLKPSEAKVYAGSINDIVTDFMDRLQDRRSESATGDMVHDVANQLYRLTFEGISYILFETRIGCLDKQIPPETQWFIDSIGLMMKNSVYVTYLPEWTRKVFPFYNRYIEGWDNIFSFGRKLIDKKLSEIEERLQKGEEVKGEYLTHLLSSEKLTMNEIYGSICELLLAGVDTTSNTITWCLYHLAQDPELQEKLYNELVKVVPKDGIPTGDDITNLPLLRAVMKETLRMYPVVPTNARIINDKELVLEGYKFPKGTLFAFYHYAISRDETNFPNPDKFYPQRWLRNQGMTHHPFCSIPFGYGVRACVGKRIAELEMHLGVARIVQTYKIKPDPNQGNVRSVARIVMSSDRPINLRFIERKSA